MFDHGKVHPQLARTREQGVDVWVERAVVAPGWTARSGERPPGPLVEESGLLLPPRLPGVLNAWVRTRQGVWLGVVSYTVSTVLGEIPMRQLAPGSALPRRWGKYEGEPF
jgi:hypothetical protein